MPKRKAEDSYVFKKHGTVTGDSSGTCLTLVVEVLVHPFVQFL